MSAPAAANELEAVFASLPGFIQELLHEPYVWLDDKLKMVAGNPQELLDAGTRYQELSHLIAGVLGSDRADVAALGQSWQGQAHEAFNAHLGEVDGAIEAVSKNLAIMPQLLQSGADACVEGANMIVELVVALLAMALSTLAISAALSVITLGASAAAGAAGVLAEAASTMARVAQVVAKVAQVLERVEEVLRKIRAILLQVKTFFEEEQAALKSLKTMSQGALGRDWIDAKLSYGIRKAVVGKEIWAVTAGAVAIPGVLGPAAKAGLDYVDGVDDAGDAEGDAAGSVP